jgi:dTDP-4-dehydrorhamnose 3,5-epimerase
MVTAMAETGRIHGVKVKALRPIADERGWLMEILRGDDREWFSRFGQVYVSATYPGVVKAWHYHRSQTDNFVCVAGMINEFFLGVHSPLLVQVPKLVYHGWKCISPEPSLVVNIPDEAYNHAHPDEERLAPHGTLPYDWTRKDG